MQSYNWRFTGTPLLSQAWGAAVVDSPKWQDKDQDPLRTTWIRQTTPSGHTLDLPLGPAPEIVLPRSTNHTGQSGFAAPAPLSPRAAGTLTPRKQQPKGGKGESKKSHFKTNLGLNPTPEITSPVPMNTWPVPQVPRARAPTALPESKLQMRPPSNTQQEERWLNRRT